MNRFIRTTAFASLLTLSAFALRAAAPGYADLGKFTPNEGCEFVEVNLGAPLLKFAAVFVDKEEPQAAALIRSLKQVRVNVVGFNDDTHAGTSDRVRVLREDLAAQGWTQIVTVKEGGKAEDVAVYVKMNSADEIDGLVVTVLDKNSKQAVFVNVVGNIKPEQLAALSKGLHIEGLSRVTIGKPGKGA